MKKRPPHVPQFESSPLAKAGVLIRKLQHHASGQSHAVSAPHRDTHYLLLLATHGRFALSLDFEALTMAAPVLLCVFPGQVHHLREMAEPQGWAISFDPALLDPEIQLVLEQGLQGPAALHEQSAFYRQAAALLDLLAQLQAGAADAYAGRATHALLAALLSLLAGQLAAGTPKTPVRRGVLIEQTFRQLLQRHGHAWKQPARYAAELAVSVAHLNDTVKELTGASVSAHIQQHAILEAKRLLCFTDLSVQEVGYAVGYDEPGYFNKLFKKITGCTPRGFRQQFRD